MTDYMHKNSLQHLQRYRNVPRTQNPPHVYAVADAAYQQMVATSRNQCIVIRSVALMCLSLAIFGNTMFVMSWLNHSLGVTYVVSMVPSGSGYTVRLRIKSLT